MHQSTPGQRTQHHQSPIKLIVEPISHHHLGYSGRETLPHVTRRSDLHFTEDPLLLGHSYTSIRTEYRIGGVIMICGTPAVRIQKSSLKRQHRVFSTNSTMHN